MSDLILALEQIEKEKGIDKEIIIEAIEKSLMVEAKKEYNLGEEVDVKLDRETGDFNVYAFKTAVSEVEDEKNEILIDEAKMIDKKTKVGDKVKIEIHTKDFGRIAATNSRNVIIQKIKEEEKKVLFNYFYAKEKDVVTGVVQRYVGKDISVNIDDKLDALLKERDQIKGEHYRPTDRIKLYIVDVDDNKGKGVPKLRVSRTHKDLVRKLFEKEVTEIADGIVEIKNIAREAGSRSKLAVWSNDENVDPVGACVGMNSTRVNSIVDDLGGEKIDIVNWSEDPAIFIENALSPSKVISVWVDEEEKTAQVVVPDDKLSLAIGKEGQNARLAAKLTGYKIDIKSESQARELGYYDDDEYYDDEYEEDYDGEYVDDYDEEYEGDYAEEGYDEEYEEGEYDEEYADEEYDDDYDSSDEENFEE